MLSLSAQYQMHIPFPVMHMPNCGKQGCDCFFRSQQAPSKCAWQLTVKKLYFHSETKLGGQVHSPRICWVHVLHCTELKVYFVSRISISCLLDAGLPTAVVLDDELEKPARTVLAIGPGASIDIDSITSQLRLYDQAE